MRKPFLCAWCLYTDSVWSDMQVRNGYLKCPVCGAETWPDMDGNRVDAIARARKKEEAERKANCSYVSLSLPDGVKVVGGTDPSGASPDMGKKPSAQQLYQRLFKQT